MIYNVQIEEFCKVYNLGQVKATKLFSTGVANRTYLVEVVEQSGAKGKKYVIKALNPSSYQKEGALKRLEVTEYISELANERGITSIPAKKISGKITNSLSGQHYIVFDFCEGKVIALNNITVENCFEIGQMLANIHNINFEELLESKFKTDIKSYNYGSKRKTPINWNKCLEEISSSNQSPMWVGRFEELIADLYEMFDLTFEPSISFIPQDPLISHTDLNNHNVLWKDGIPHFIDWERACLIDATYDCLFSAMRWATKNRLKSKSDKNNSLDKDRLYAFFEGYTEKRHINTSTVKVCLYIIIFRKLLYLRSNIKKYLNIEDEIDKKRVDGVIVFTLYILKGYINLINDLDNITNYIIKCQARKE